MIARTRLSANARGVAMIIALMMSAVLSLLALQFSLTGRDHVQTAREAQSRSENLLAVHSTESELTFALLTESWAVSSDEKASQWARAWNFQGEPFEIANRVVTIQDESGLMPIPQPGDATDLFSDLLIEVGVEPARADRIARDLGELQFDRSGSTESRAPIQSLHELVDLSSLTESERESLATLTTIYPVAHFNPDTAPDPVLRVRIPDRDVDTLIRLRADRIKNEKVYRQEIAAMTDELIVPVVGPAFRWSARVEGSGQNLSRSGTMVIRPYSNEPVVFWSYRRLDR